MSDLVARLQNEGADALRKHLSLGMHGLCAEAAERIEALEAALSQRTSEAVGTIHSMGWENDAETGAEVFYVHMRFAAPPSLSPRLCWDTVPMTLAPSPTPAQMTFEEAE